MRSRTVDPTWRTAGLILAAAAALTALPAVAAAQAVTGMVFDESSSAPLPGAEVRLLDATFTERGTAVTDAVGRFSLKAEGAGVYVVVASAKGYLNSSPAEIRLDDAGTASLMVSLQPAEGFQVRDRVADGAEPYVFGQVYDRESEDPVEGAEVIISSGPDTVRTSTRWNGRFVVREFFPGRATVRVEHLAFAPEQRVVEMDPGKAYEIRVAMRTEAIELPGIEVTVRSRSMARYLEPFYQRMDLAMGGEYIDRDDLATTGSQPVGYVLNNRLPSVKALRGLGGFWKVSARGQSCTEAAIFVDRLMVHRPGSAGSQDGTDALEMSTTQIEGVEFYPGPATLPPEFNHPGVTCAVVIWTRRGG